MFASLAILSARSGAWLFAGAGSGYGRWSCWLPSSPSSTGWRHLGGWTGGVRARH